MTFKPMLAGKIDPPFILSTSRFPLFVSAKLDGVRAMIQNGKVVSRSLKLHPNEHTQKLLGRHELEGLDGELMVGDPTAPDVFRKTGSAVGSIRGKPNVVFHVFDIYHPTMKFRERFELATKIVEAFGEPYVQMVPHSEVTDPATLLKMEALALDMGYEGVMIRDPKGPYKQNRVTDSEGWLMKLKRFLDGEGEVLEFIEGQHNMNPSTTNELGRTSRSTCKEGMVANGTFGSMVVRNLETGVIHKVSPGKQSMKECQQMWDARERYIGKIAKFTYFPSGSKDKPRFPQFAGWRNPEDMS